MSFLSFLSCNQKYRTFWLTSPFLFCENKTNWHIIIWLGFILRASRGIQMVSGKMVFGNVSLGLWNMFTEDKSVTIWELSVIFWERDIYSQCNKNLRQADIQICKSNLATNTFCMVGLHGVFGVNKICTIYESGRWYTKVHTSTFPWKLRASYGNGPTLQH